MFLFSRASPGRERTPDSLPHIGPRFPPKGRFVTSTSLLPLFLISASLLIPFNTSFFHLSFFAVFLSIKLLTIQFTSIGEFIVCSFFLSLSLFVFVPFLSSVKVSRNYLSRYDENKSFLFFFFIIHTLSSPLMLCLYVTTSHSRMMARNVLTQFFVPCIAKALNPSSVARE